MRRNSTIILGVTAVVAISTIFYLSNVKRARRTMRQRRTEVADEGYETAFDILFPEKPRRFSRYGMR